ncbi:MAG TPA: hypothetical protein VI895_08035 [Bdellovibrionota bacterium]|nr:hypothetical protein [Bdellovibrionota bacterium]
MAKRLGLIAFLLLFSACGVTDTIDSFQEAVQRYSIVIADGNEQADYVGTELIKPLAVVVQGNKGDYLGDQFVEFSILDGDARIVGETIVPTAPDGSASTRIQLGNSPSQIQVRAALRVEPFDESRHAVVFTLTAVPFPPAKLFMFDSQSNGQTGTVNQKLPLPLRVVAKDSRGNPVVAQDIEFRVARGSPDIQVTNLVKTDSNGVSATEVILGKTAESISIEATWLPNDNNDPNRKVTFSATSSPSDTKILSFVGHISDGKRACAAEGSNFPGTGVRLSDLYGNPIAGAKVRVDPDSRGKIDDQPFGEAKDLDTDESGVASFTLTAGSVSGSAYNAATTVTASVPAGPTSSAAFDITKGRYLFNSRGDGNTMYLYGITLAFGYQRYFDFPFVVSARGACWSSLPSTFISVSRLQVIGCPGIFPSTSLPDPVYWQVTSDANGDVSTLWRELVGDIWTGLRFTTRLTAKAAGTNDLIFYVSHPDCE